ELVDAASGQQAWSMRFDRNPQDVFAVQDEIAVAVAQALELRLDADASQQLVRHGTRNLAAWLAYQQARALLATRKIADIDRAQQRLADAIRLDPAFSAAYVALAEAHIAAAFFQHSEFWFGEDPDLSPAQKSEVASLLARALTLDPNNGEAYLIRAWQSEDDA